MPLTTYVGTSEFTEVIKTELIPQTIDAFEYDPTVALTVAASQPGKGNIAVRFPRLNEFSVPAGTVAETVDHPDANVDITESSITPGMVRFRVPISDEAVVMAEAGIPTDVLREVLTAMLVRLDSDLLSASTAATLSTGAVGVAFGLGEFHAARQYYRAQKIEQFGGRHALVLHTDAIDALENSIRASSSPWALKEGDVALKTALGMQYQGAMNGIDIFQSALVADEGAGHSNFMTPMGGRVSGLGLVLNEMPSIKMERGNEGESRASSFYHCRMWYGTGIRNPRRFVEVLSA